MYCPLKDNTFIYVHSLNVYELGHTWHFSGLSKVTSNSCKVKDFHMFLAFTVEFDLTADL